jgi:hypothetical protein
MGTAPTEFTAATAAAHSHFGPRIWPAGLRVMSMRAAILRMPSPAAAARMSLRVRSLRLPERRLPLMSSPYGPGLSSHA